jgi:hypothetical protein
MTVEYVLLLALFAIAMAGTVIKGPFGAFENAGPKLGARVERNLITGDGFMPGGKLNKWVE